MQRIGVFVCHCGTNIAATVDVKTVAETLGHEPGVVISQDYQYMCSESGQNLVKNAIKEHNLTGVVICSCSPRMHENTFRKAAAAAGLNPYLVEIANIREQCSWIHKDIATATDKAIILGKAAVAKVHLNAPLTAGESPVAKRALVIGGGIAGIQTALDIAEAGFDVDIVEKQPTIGGKMAQIDKTFPTLDCAACILTPKMVEASQNEHITIHSFSEVTDVKGFVGNFTVTIKKKARYVDETKCTGCGVSMIPLTTHWAHRMPAPAGTNIIDPSTSELLFSGCSPLKTTGTFRLKPFLRAICLKALAIGSFSVFSNVVIFSFVRSSFLAVPRQLIISISFS